MYKRIMERERVCLDGFRFKYQMAEENVKWGRDGSKEELARASCQLIAAELAYGNGGGDNDRVGQLNELGRGMAFLSLINLVEVLCECPETFHLSDDELEVILLRIHKLRPGLRPCGDLTAGEIAFLGRLRMMRKGCGNE